MRYSPERARQAVAHLRRSDSVLRPVIDNVGPFRLRLQTDRFHMLARAIISQQISTAAARTIQKRFVALLAPEPVSAAALLMIPSEQLQAVGVSKQKAGYLRSLAEHVTRGDAPLRTIGRLDDEAIIAALTQIKGVGRWTAQMFLIFSLGRLDVLPHDDLGVRNAIRRLYGLNELPGKQECFDIAEPWRPYASVAAWYCWRSLE